VDLIVIDPSAPSTAFPGVRLKNTLVYWPGKCVNCGMCTSVCPHAVFAPGIGAVRLEDPDSCMECGACQMNCPVGAIRVESGVGCAWTMIKAALTGKKVVAEGRNSALDSSIGRQGDGGLQQSKGRKVKE
jgi:ferredoxin